MESFDKSRIKLAVATAGLLVVGACFYYRFRTPSHPTLAQKLTNQFKRHHDPDTQSFAGYRVAEKDKYLVHLLKFDRVDTTMRIADEFRSTSTYIKGVNDQQPQDPKEEPLAHAIAFQALVQTQGRGQQSNKWLTPDGANCAVTIVLEVENMPVNASIVTALAIHETIVKYLPDHKQDVKLKWINDVFIQGKKVSGVLVACQNGHFKSGKPCFRLDIGIGVNLNSSPLEGSACLKDLKGEAIDVDQFVDLLCINVVKKFRQLDEEGFSRANQKKKYQGPTLHYQITELLEFKGERVKIFDIKLENVLHEGIFLSINDFGHALLQNDQNEVKTIIDGRMRRSDTN